MRAVLFNGSPRGASSNTEVMLGALADGLRAGGAEAVVLRLAEKRISFCAGCYSCWTKTPGHCVHDDDMRGLIESMAGADLLVFGSPLYFNNVSGTLKTFFDRLTAAGGDPHKAAAGDTSAAAPKIVMISNCGFPHRAQFDVLSLWIKHVAAMMRSDLIGEFYTTNGKVLTQPVEDQLAVRERYLDFLRTCGRTFGEGELLTAELKVLTEKNILDF